MRKRKDRVIIDTNLWISFLLTKNLSGLDSIINSNEVTLLFTHDLLTELIEVTQRSKFRKYFSEADLELLLLKMSSRSLFIEVSANVAICRDPKDDFLLSLAIDGNATHIITGDKDLLVIGKYGKTRILTIKEYLQNP